MLQQAAERRKDLWLLTESDKVLEEALATIDEAMELVRAAVWESSHFLRQNRWLQCRSRSCESSDAPDGSQIGV